VGVVLSLLVVSESIVVGAPPLASLDHGAIGLSPGDLAGLPSADRTPNPYSIAMPASLVIGQPDFTTHTAGANATTQRAPSATTVDRAGDLWVADTFNNRVLEYVPALGTGMAASVVLGQASLTSSGPAGGPAGLSAVSSVRVGPSGSVWVADSGNNRVLEFVPPFSSGMSASLVLGQSSFNGTSSGTSASALFEPTDLSFSPTGDLFVSDHENSRIVEFAPPFSIGMNATVALGQPDLQSGAGATSATGLSHPFGVAFNATGALFVGDESNNRVVAYRPPFTTGEAASLVVGQAALTTSAEGTNSTALHGPLGVAVDSRDNLWVADVMNSRTLEFVPPFVNGMAATVVLGQPSFTSATPAVTRAGEAGPFGVATDASDNLWVADEVGNRVLEYVPTQFSLQFVESGLAYGAEWSVTLDGTSHSGATPLITAMAENGSHAWTVEGLHGYALSPRTGTAIVNGTPSVIEVAFNATGVAAPPSPAFPLLVGGLGLVVAIESVLLAWLLPRLRKSR